MPGTWTHCCERWSSWGASDLHLSAREVPRIRLDGEIRPLEDWTALTPDRIRALINPVMPPSNREQYDATHDTDFAHEIPDLARFRVNVFADRKGPGIVFRVIPAEILTAEQLGLPRAILDLCQLSKGLVLVTGPTGSGKSTTLAAMIDHINRTRHEHVITIEDPIEFVHDNHRCLINQREVHTHTDGFKTALRAALREDPDIVLVGELRDLETIAIAIETAETGHLVFGTLHTTTACSTIDRIIDSVPRRPPRLRYAPCSRSRCKRRDRADAVEEDRRRARRGAGDSDGDPRDLQSDPRGQDVPDPQPDADGAKAGDGSYSTTR